MSSWLSIVIIIIIIIILFFLFIGVCRKKSSPAYPINKDDVLYKYLNNNATTKYVFEEFDKRIVELRLKFQKLSSDRRIPIELCDKDDKLGAMRESEIKTMGNNCEPWISRECIFVLDNILSSNANGLEWSSGSSTMWLNYRIKSLVSVENSKEWYEKVKEKIYKRKRNEKVKLIWIGEDNLSYCRDDRQYISEYYKKNTCFKTYVVSKLIPETLYDFISIDGRARTGCILRAIKMIKKNNGIIIIDNAERNRYQWVFNHIPSNWTRHYFWYQNGLVIMFITHINNNM